MDRSKWERTGFVCGARTVMMDERGIYRVVCATCGAGGSWPHDSRGSANRACVRDSNRPCRACGAR